MNLLQMKVIALLKITGDFILSLYYYYFLLLLLLPIINIIINIISIVIIVIIVNQTILNNFCFQKLGGLMVRAADELIFLNLFQIHSQGLFLKQSTYFLVHT